MLTDTMLTATIMEREAREAPQRIQQQLNNNAATAQELGQRLRTLKPSFVFMVGRGSSDHAGVFGKYLIEVELGVPVVAAAPSVKSVFSSEVNLTGSAVILVAFSFECQHGVGPYRDAAIDHASKMHSQEGHRGVWDGVD